MVAQYRYKMIKQTVDFLLKGVIGISLFDLALISLGQAPAIDAIVGHWLQIVFTAVGLFYFLLSIPHKRKMQKLERVRTRLENEKLQKEIDEID